MIKTIVIDGQSLTIEEVVAIAKEDAKVILSEDAKERVEATRKAIDKMVANERVVYGVTTGFGTLQDVVIPSDKVEQLQLNLLRSHAVGTGPLLPKTVVRGMILIRANSLARGLSGIRLETVQTLLSFLNEKIHPLVPSKGSLGASGDLAPLAHIALVLVGEGEADVDGIRLTGADALERKNLEPLVLGAKEGLALINGTQGMTSIAALAVNEAEILLDSADIVSGMTLEALRGCLDAFDPRIQACRLQPGQIKVAENIRRITRNSKLVRFQQPHQDPYSLRCVPQVHGAVRDVVSFVKSVVERELNSVTDNPLVFCNPNGSADVLSGGNFHGEPVGFASDILTIVMTSLSSISERRLERLLNPNVNQDLPPFLTDQSGLNSGLMITQYTAAALVSENKSKSFPSTADSIPVSGGQEDFVSMGMNAALKLAQVIENVFTVLALESIAACQALDFVGKEGENLGEGTKNVWKEIRSRIDHVDQDRVLQSDIKQMISSLKAGNFPKWAGIQEKLS